VLAEPGPVRPDDRRRLAGLAALTGRADLAAAHAAAGLERSLRGLPVELERDAARLTVYAAMGTPVDSIQALERRVERRLATLPNAPLRAAARYQLLARSVSLAFHLHDFEIVRNGDLGADYLLLAIRDQSAADSAAMRREIERWRVRNRALGQSVDGAYSEALLLVRLGQMQLVREWLEPAFDALVWSPPLMIDDAVSVAATIRAALQLAQTLDSVEPAEARRWRNAADVLWGGGREAGPTRLRAMPQPVANP
jgi:hypothetical protein